VRLEARAINDERKATCENYNVPWSEHPIQQVLMACAEELEISMKGHETIVLEAQGFFTYERACVLLIITCSACCRRRLFFSGLSFEQFSIRGFNKSNGFHFPGFQLSKDFFIKKISSAKS
jgi:hypothetical protein